AHYTATRKFYSLLPEAEIRNAQRAACSLALEKGVTSIHEMGGASNQDSKVLLESISGLPIHVKPYLATLDVSKAIAAGLDCVGGDLPLDGSIGSRTAAMNQPYEDSEGSGFLYRTDDELTAFFVEATRAGVQAGIHAIGDAAIAQAIRCVEHALLTLGPEGSVGASNLRHRIEHFECVSPELVEKAVSLGVVPSVQPTFDLYWGGNEGMYSTRLGSRASSMNPFSMMTRLGLTLAGGSDSPVTPLDPFMGIRAAMTHHRPDFAVPFDEALRMFTIWAAAGAHEEGERGSIEPGKRADFCVVSGDPTSVLPQEIPAQLEGEVIQTWVGGHIAYER
ncbi:MAG: amidohydrolase, partial [Acidimicrobiia bacterium]